MRRAASVGTILVALVGCGDGTPTDAGPPGGPNEKAPAVSHFNPAATGQLVGRVRWGASIPEVPMIVVERFAEGGTKVEHIRRPNPHAPLIDPQSLGLQGAVVFLRGIDPEFAKPWDHPPVSVEMHDERPIVRQGDALRLVGFVRRGDTVAVVSKQPIFHSARFRGAAFCTLMLPDPDRLRRRTLSETGRVEITSAAGYTALRGHLFVDEHPYYSVTDAEGRFKLDDVPAGNYDLVCWRPDWRIERQERDPETLLRVRLHFYPPQETVVPVRVRPGQTATVAMEVP